jgi:hypothetical protein
VFWPVKCYSPIEFLSSKQYYFLFLMADFGLVFNQRITDSMGVLLTVLVFLFQLWYL